MSGVQGAAGDVFVNGSARRRGAGGDGHVGGVNVNGDAWEVQNRLIGGEDMKCAETRQAKKIQKRR